MPKVGAELGLVLCTRQENGDQRKITVARLRERAFDFGLLEGADAVRTHQDGGTSSVAEGLLDHVYAAGVPLDAHLVHPYPQVVLFELRADVIGRLGIPVVVGEQHVTVLQTITLVRDQYAQLRFTDDHDVGARDAVPALPGDVSIVEQRPAHAAEILDPEPRGVPADPRVRPRDQQVRREVQVDLDPRLWSTDDNLRGIDIERRFVVAE